MTVAELIEHLRVLPPEFPVYGIDSGRDWLPLRVTDVRGMHFSKLGRDVEREDDFYFVLENDYDSPNGVGIGI